MEKLYPIGIQNFEKLREYGYCYVDKTELLFDLVSKGQYYFLSRPRRFGKSLMISTLHSYFDGRKDLFNGLGISYLEKEWKKYPVLHIDLNTGKYDSVSTLTGILDEYLTRWENLYGRSEAEKGLERRFAGIIRRAHEKTGKQAVILVDEYDKPLLAAIGNDALQDEFRNILKAFYGALKSEDGHIRFAMLTGVTKFGKISVFSDLNNLNDISMDEKYVRICGITEDELTGNFSDDILALAENNGQTADEARARLKEDYDGYHFYPYSPGIYNPFSLLNTFSKGRYGSYWFETGTPTYLAELLKKSGCDLEQMSHVEVDSDTIDSIFADKNPIPVIYQSGYLTIKKYDPRFGIYELGFPNREVEEGFMNFLLPYYANVSKTNSPFEIKRFVTDIESGDISGFMGRLQTFLAGCPYELAKDIELYYQNVLFIVFRLAGLYTMVEYHTSKGRIDLVLQTEKYVYIMEFKLDGSAEEAIAQIREKEYALPFAKDGRTVYEIGVNFSSAARNIERWIVA